MQKIYIDESGSQTKANAGSHPFFTITMVKALDEKELKKSYRRFINKYRKQIEESDSTRRQQMFAEGRFLELKGSSFTPSLKKSFVRYFAAKPCFELYYIRFDNSRMDTVFYENTARAFNYVLKLAFEYFARGHHFQDDEYHLLLDERNVKTGTKYVLREYLNTELKFDRILTHGVKVEYKDSQNSFGIQLADVFGNIYYSEQMRHHYTSELDMLRKSGILKGEFVFPQKERKSKTRI